MTRIQLSASFIRGVEEAVKEAFKETNLVLGREFTQVISDPSAFREFPGQDIVDTGALRASQEVQFTDDIVTFRWPVQYAEYVHEGYTLRSGRKQPARPWTRVAMRRKNPQSVFNTILRNKLRGQQP